MSISYFDGADAPKSGSRIFFPGQTESSVQNSVPCEDTCFIRASSTEIRHLIEDEIRNGRTRWAQLTIELDDVLLAFWLPSELEIYRKVFAMVPFPTAKTLLRGPRIILN